MSANQPDPALGFARLARASVEDILGPTLAAFEDVRAAADDLEDDAALGRRVREIIAAHAAARIAAVLERRRRAGSGSARRPSLTLV